MKDKIYGIAFAVALFSLLAISLGSGIGKAGTYEEPGEGNGIDYSASGSSCTIWTDGENYQLDIDFSPGADGAYAAGGMGFTMEKDYYTDEDWTQSIKEPHIKTKGKTDSANGLFTYTYYNINENNHKTHSSYKNNDYKYRTDTFHCKITQHIVNMYGYDSTSVKQKNYQTSFNFKLHSGPIG